MRKKLSDQLRIIVQLRKFEKELEAAMLKVATFFKEERDPFYKRGQAIGIEKGIEKGIEAKSYEFVFNLLTAGKFTIAEIANYATVSEDFVRKVRADLDKRK